jgi:hypothetical protein
MRNNKGSQVQHAKKPAACGVEEYVKKLLNAFSHTLRCQFSVTTVSGSNCLVTLHTCWRVKEQALSSAMGADMPSCAA